MKYIPYKTLYLHAKLVSFQNYLRQNGYAETSDSVDVHAGLNLLNNPSISIYSK